MGGGESKVEAHEWQEYGDFVREQTPTPGDLLEFSRLGGTYKHWAVYEGFLKHDGIEDHWVIHFSGEPTDKKGAKIRRDKLSAVAGESLFRVNNDSDNEMQPLNPEKIVERARSKLNRSGYNVAVDNCEHFARWCRSDRYVSKQKGLSFWDFLFNAPAHPLVSGNAWLEERRKHPDERGNWMDNLTESEKYVVLERMSEGYPDGY